MLTRVGCAVLVVGAFGCADWHSPLASRSGIARSLDASSIPYASGVHAAAIPELDTVASCCAMIGDVFGVQGMNDLGEVVGTHLIRFQVPGTGQFADSMIAFSWTRDFGVRFLRAAPGNPALGFSNALGVNDRAQVVVTIPGSRGDSVLSYVGIWNWFGGVRRLRNLSDYFQQTPLPLGSPCSATGINLAGVAIGVCAIAANAGPIATVWSAFGTPWPLTGHVFAASANGISDAGYIAGGEPLMLGGNHGLVFTPSGQMRVLPNPPSAHTQYAVALAVNDSGYAAGYRVSTDSGCANPVAWLAADTAIVIGPCGGFENLGPGGARSTSAATGISDDGIVVGTASAPNVPQFAFVWTPASGLERLPGLAAGIARTHEYSAAIGINKRHQVIGWVANDVEGYHHVVVWSLPGGA